MCGKTDVPDLAAVILLEEFLTQRPVTPSESSNLDNDTVHILAGLSAFQKRNVKESGDRSVDSIILENTREERRLKLTVMLVKLFLNGPSGSDVKRHVLYRILIPDVLEEVCAKFGLRLQVGVTNDDRGFSLLSVTWSFRKKTFVIPKPNKNLESGRLLDIRGPEGRLYEYLKELQQVGDEVLEVNNDRYFVSRQVASA